MKSALAAFCAAALLIAVLAPTAFAYDDYPYQGLAPDALEIDEWGFYKATCTSFVAWRLIYTNGVAFSCGYGGVHWGNSNEWDDAARLLGIDVDGVPAVGAVAQTDDGTDLGHVAWVAAVDGDLVTIEEYNFGHIGADGYYTGQRAYNTRTVDASLFCYIHVADLEEPYEIYPDGTDAQMTDAAFDTPDNAASAQTDDGSPAAESAGDETAASGRWSAPDGGKALIMKDRAKQTAVRLLRRQRIARALTLLFPTARTASIVRKMRSGEKG